VTSPSSNDRNDFSLSSFRYICASLRALNLTVLKLATKACEREAAGEAGGLTRSCSGLLWPLGEAAHDGAAGHHAIVLMAEQPGAAAARLDDKIQTMGICVPTGASVLHLQGSERHGSIPTFSGTTLHPTKRSRFSDISWDEAVPSQLHLS
jgi:hypothetical protein